MTDPYRILGVNRSSSENEIKNAYRQLAKKHHPDKGGDSEHFANINAAYDSIKDHNARQNFDNDPSNFQQSQPRQNPFGRNFGAGFDDMFNNMFGQNLHPNARRPHRQQPQHVNITLQVTLEEVYSCIEKNINITMPNGLSKPIKLKIPPGVHDGAQVRYPGMSPDGADLLVMYKIISHSIFTVEDYNLHMQLNVNLSDVMLGADKVIMTLDNRSIKLHIKAGTQIGTKFRIRESGMPRPGNSNGDLFIEIKAHIPILDESDLNKSFADVLATKLSN